METFGGSCRLCLWKGDKMISVFLGRDSIISKIKLCLPIQVNIDDSLPKEICYQCNYKLEVFSEFYQTCIRSDKILKQYSSQIRRNVIPEVKLEINAEVVIEDDDFTSNDSLLKSKLDSVNHRINSLNSEKEGLGSSSNGTKNSGNSVISKINTNNELTKNSCDINKVNDNYIKPSKSYCIHNMQTCYKCIIYRNKTSLVSNSPSKNVNVKDSLSNKNGLFSEAIKSNNDCVVESVSKNCRTLCTSSSPRNIRKSHCSLDNTDIDDCELEKCAESLLYKSPEKFPDCNYRNYLQTPFDNRGSSELTCSNIDINCYQETNINEDDAHRHKSISSKTDSDSVSTHSDQDNEQKTVFEESTCSAVSEDHTVSKELRKDEKRYSDKSKISTTALHVENYRTYLTKIKNQKNSLRTYSRMKLDPKKGRQCEKTKIKNNRNQKVHSILVQKVYSCHYCKRKYSSMKWCLRHEKSHTIVRKYNCTECNCNFPSLVQLNKHECIELYLRNIKNDHSYCSNSLENNEKCDKCGKAFHSIVSLSKHSQNCFLKKHLRNSSNFKKTHISNHPQQKRKKFVSINMKSSLRKISVN